MLPQNGYVKLADEDQAKGLQKMLDLLEDNDDVQNIFYNGNYKNRHWIFHPVSAVFI